LGTGFSWTGGRSLSWGKTGPGTTNRVARALRRITAKPGAGIRLIKGPPSGEDATGARSIIYHYETPIIRAERL
jgi:hypothetical protein